MQKIDWYCLLEKEHLTKTDEFLVIKMMVIEMLINANVAQVLHFVGFLLISNVLFVIANELPSS